jgi:hypothetical protein
VAGVVLHTDQGGEFCGGELTRVCAAAGITQSMGRTGSALDNAVAEAFHSTLEFELRSRERFATKAQARRAVMEWLEEYNTVRFHSTNGMLSPVDYEHGRRRPGAKTYDQLRRRHRHTHRNNPDRKDENISSGPKKNQAEAASPPETLDEPLRGGHRRCALTGPSLAPQGPPTAVATATPLDPVAAAPGSAGALDPRASTGPAGNTNGRPGPAAAHAQRNPEQDP